MSIHAVGLRTASVLAAGALAAAIAAPAAADRSATPPDRSGWDDLVWEPYRTQPFTSPAGQLCAFTLRADPVADEEMVATVARFPDGSPKIEAYKGRLVVRYTNVESGAATDKDLSGSAVVRYFEDGAYTMYMYGPVGMGFRETDRYPRGMYVLDGFHVVHTGADPADRDREMLVDGGSEHDICGDLD
ncbi:MAG TPA: hypothetical protein VNP20_00515 [Nocardioidaceae bacterium]|nr:hypothetical protein [Nocardioidaceae bacterium]